MIKKITFEKSSFYAMDGKQIKIKNKLGGNKRLKVAAFDNNKTVTQAHKHNGYLELVLLTDTKGYHYKDGKKFAIKSPCILIIQKDNVHHWELTSPVQGYVLLLKEEFVDQSHDFELARLLDIITELDIIYLQVAYPLNDFFRILTTEENQICQEGILKALLSKSLEGTKLKKNNPSVTLNLFQRFSQILQNEVIVINHVAHYAKLLHTTPQNLNVACRKHAKCTASALIAFHIIKKAKRLLIYTDNTVAEIAFQLGFTDKSNFSKFFKRQVGQTPSAFTKEKH